MDTEKMKQDLGGGNVFEVGEPNTAFAQYFIGQSYLKMLTTERVGIGNVTFEPGCRNNWHIHHKGGQILLVTGGRGWYQEWGKPAQELHAWRCCEHSAGSKTLAWSSKGQLVPASGSRGAGRGSIQRVA